MTLSGGIYTAPVKVSLFRDLHWRWVRAHTGDDWKILKSQMGVTYLRGCHRHRVRWAAGLWVKFTQPGRRRHSVSVYLSIGWWAESNVPNHQQSLGLRDSSWEGLGGATFFFFFWKTHLFCPERKNSHEGRSVIFTALGLKWRLKCFSFANATNQRFSACEKCAKDEGVHFKSWFLCSSFMAACVRQCSIDNMFVSVMVSTQEAPH